MTGVRLTPVEGMSSHGGFPGPWGTTCIQTSKEQWLFTVMVPVVKAGWMMASRVKRMAMPVADRDIRDCIFTYCKLDPLVSRNWSQIGRGVNDCVPWVFTVHVDEGKPSTELDN
jgi:hypothetical protein